VDLSEAEKKQKPLKNFGGGGGRGCKTLMVIFFYRILAKCINKQKRLWEYVEITSKKSMHKYAKNN
jgi:hypothetical protein